MYLYSTIPSLLAIPEHDKVINDHLYLTDRKGIMKTPTNSYCIILLAVICCLISAQTKAQKQKATQIETSESVIEVPSIAINFPAQPLVADFTVSDSTICEGRDTVTFTDLSQGSPIWWYWSFPGGSLTSYSGPYPPPIYYFTPGQYNVSLIVVDSTSSDTITKVNYITVKYVIADFAGTPVSIGTGDPVTFTDNSSCYPTSWNWSFPGGTPGSFAGQNPPAIIYDSAGTYNVKLNVSNAHGTDSIVKPGYISVSGCNYCPSTYSNTTDDWITNVTFNTINNNSGQGGSDSYEDFTAISTDIMQGISYPISISIQIGGTWTQHARAFIDWNRNCDFTDPGEAFDLGSLSNTGTLNASITVPDTAQLGTTRMRIIEQFQSDPLACNPHPDVYGETEDYTVNISVNTNPPVAGFSADDTRPDIGQTVNFTDSSKNIPTSWAWSINPPTVTFVGGTNTTSQNPQVQFTTVGIYTVGLQVGNAFGNDTVSKTGYIEVLPYLTVSPDFQYVPVNIGQDTFYVTNTGTGTMNWAAAVAETDTSWLNIVSGSSGIDDGPILVNYEANAGFARTGKIIVTATGALNSPDTVEVRQGGKLVLPWVEDFEDVGPTQTFTADQNIINGTDKWSYNKTQNGRLRFEAGSGFYHSGSHAATLDADPTGTISVNYLIATLDLSAYTSSKLVLSFYYMHHGEESHANDRVWIRGSSTDSWVQIYDLYANRANAGVWKEVSRINIDSALSGAGQTLSSTFQIRFGQEDNRTAISTTEFDGFTFDDITVADFTPKVDFVADNTFPADSSTRVYFTDQTTNSPTSWVWTITPGTYFYQGGTNDTSQNPTVSFNAVGTYTVALNATNAYSADTVTKTDYIHMGIPGLWTGSMNSEWDTITNWNNYIIPTSTTNASITTAAINMPVKTGNLIIGSDCDSLIMGPGVTGLTVTGDLTISTVSKIFFIITGIITCTH